MVIKYTNQLLVYGNGLMSDGLVNRKATEEETAYYHAKIASGVSPWNIKLEDKEDAYLKHVAELTRAERRRDKLEEEQLNKDVTEILEYFNKGFDDVEAGSGEKQPMHKLIKRSLKLIRTGRFKIKKASE